MLTLSCLPFGFGNYFKHFHQAGLNTLSRLRVFNESTQAWLVFHAGAWAVYLGLPGHHDLTLSLPLAPHPASLALPLAFAYTFLLQLHALSPLACPACNSSFLLLCPWPSCIISLTLFLLSNELIPTIA